MGRVSEEARHVFDEELEKKIIENAQLINTVRIFSFELCRGRTA